MYVYLCMYIYSYMYISIYIYIYIGDCERLRNRESNELVALSWPEVALVEGI